MGQPDPTRNQIDLTRTEPDPTCPARFATSNFSKHLSCIIKSPGLPIQIN